MRSQKIRQQKRNKGATAIELIATMPVLIVVMMLSIDLAVLMFGVDFCDRTCKDCARVAGQMSTPDKAVNAMNAAAAAHRIDGFVINKMYSELVVYEDYNYSTKSPTPKYGSTVDYLGKNGPDNITPSNSANDKKSKKVDYIDPNQLNSPGPYVVVQTSLVMRIPITISFFDLKLIANNVKRDPQLFKVQSLYTFPITNVYTPN
jgi:hypothetical protein